MPQEQPQHWPAVGAVRVLGPKIVGLRAPGDMEHLVLNDLDRAKAVLQRGNLCGRRVQIRLFRGAREGGQVVGRAVASVSWWWGIDRDGRANHDGGHGDHNE